MFYYRRVINRRSQLSFHGTVRRLARFVTRSALFYQRRWKTTRRTAAAHAAANKDVRLPVHGEDNAQVHPEERGTPGEAGFLTKTSAEYAFRHPRDDESGKRYRSDEPGSIIPTRVPLAPLTRERNLLAPARCALPAAFFSSFTWSSLTRGHNGSWSLFLLPRRWGKSIDH